MKSYTLAEFAKTMGVSPKMIKQWEKDFKTYISIPRTKQGARIYTEAEANFFQNIKSLYEKKLKKYEIMNYLKSQDTQIESTHVAQEESSAERMIVMNREMMDANSANKDFQDTTPHVKDELQEELEGDVSNIIEEETDQVAKHLHSMSDLKSGMQKISNKNEATTHALVHSIEQINEATEHHAQSIQNFQDTNIEMLEELEETLQEEREHDLSTLEHERKLYEQKIMERERAFRKLVLSFRESTAAEMKKTKKWWKFWEMIK
jgi:MerR family transcriptional regulator, light-induced transcriptional regulator